MLHSWMLWCKKGQHTRKQNAVTSWWLKLRILTVTFLELCTQQYNWLSYTPHQQEWLQLDQATCWQDTADQAQPKDSRPGANHALFAAAHCKFKKRIQWQPLWFHLHSFTVCKLLSFAAYLRRAPAYAMQRLRKILAIQQLSLVGHWSRILVKCHSVVYSQWEHMPRVAKASHAPRFTKSKIMYSTPSVRTRSTLMLLLWQEGSTTFSCINFVGNHARVKIMWVNMVNRLEQLADMTQQQCPASCSF